MSAAEIIAALGGRPSSKGWGAADCVVCGGSGKLGIKDGEHCLVVHCFKGCPPIQIRAELRRRGLFDPANHKRAPRPTKQELRRQREAEAADRARRIGNARWIWEQECIGVASTPADVYLASRGIWFDRMPETIRFRHGYANSNRPPAMVCRIDHVSEGSIGIHQTFLTHDGRKASVDPVRNVIGACGGGSVHFGEPKPDQWLVVGEGIETTLSMALSIGAPGWAALSATGIKNLILPPDARMVLIAADNDANGTGQSAADDAAMRWWAEGRRVKVCIPPHPDTDWNDVLQDRGRSHAA